jgi:hypothetical protein
LLAARFRDRFDIEQQWAVKYNDLSQALLRYEPHIVHFSGHGSDQGSLFLADQSGKRHKVRASSLADLFSLFSSIRCVVLNACWSAEQAEAIAQEIDVVIGMKRVISDSAATEFAGAFYQGLGFGRSVQDAFRLGRVQIDLANLPEEATPQILTRPGVDASSITFV